MLQHQVILLIGSNMGDRKFYLDAAIDALKKQIGDLVKSSSIYESEAWGNENQASFYNQVLVFESFMNPDLLLEKILQIEIEIGRIRKEKWGPRVIDIDILFYDNEIITKENLIIPHPFIHLRGFTLIPLAELLPNFIHPVLKITIQELIIELKDKDTLAVFKI